ncbi:MAG: heme ABC exporter ATP-binding protein CcmA [Rhodospirillaceae bacterium]|nr:heme ABC exporter ATP-binding protein CcmA [Rhodospirillaceae bacterium]MBT6116798.1 heme ABC exporter ATP-binding protein CcmA [Rhodospirillaceae bacterium]
MAIFAGRNLTCTRGERLVFRGLDFALDEGEALILLGPNGSGKSSLLRLMAALAAPAGGALLWHDADLRADRAGHFERLHYLGHADAVKPALTVVENLGFWARLHGTDEAAARRALERVALDSLADTPTRYLSAGQRRRLAIARLFAAPKPLWLLDEPSVGLDNAALETLEHGFAEHRAGGGIIVVATHTALDLPAAESLVLADFAPEAGADLLDDDDLEWVEDGTEDERTEP